MNQIINKLVIKLTLRILIFPMIIVTVFGCKSSLYVQEEKVAYKNIEIPLYETSINDIKKQFGLKYEKFDWNEYSTEYIYDKKGISFSHKKEDSLRMVYWINAETSRNVINIENRIRIGNKTTVSDVVEELGNSTWDYDSTYSGLIIEYEYFDIIVALTESDIQFLNKKSISEDWGELYELFKTHNIKGIEVY